MELDALLQRILAVSNDAVVQPLSKLFSDYVKQDDTIIVYILLALAVGFLIGRYRASRLPSFQNRGEALLSAIVLKNFSPPDYHLMNHVTLQLNDGTTQIDHILISRFGVFVIETKDYRGWIFANANRSNWTQVLFRSKFRFQNPILQNNRHVRAVQHHLDFLPRDAIKPVVVFTGEAEFRTETPGGVFSTVKFIHYLREQTEEIMSLNRMQFCVGRLETARLAISGETDVEHVENLNRRHRNAS